MTEYMTEFTVPDTLVLKIIEYYNFDKKDTILYILYDNSINRYVIRGKRHETSLIKNCTYSFECDTTHGLAEFIEFLVDSENYVSCILYNYDNLPLTSDEITYEFLEEHDKIQNEISGYDKKKLERKYLLKLLGILKNVFNYNN